MSVGCRSHPESKLSQLEGKLSQSEGKPSQLEGKLSQSEGELSQPEGKLSQLEGKLSRLREPQASGAPLSERKGMAGCGRDAVAECHSGEVSIALDSWASRE